MPNYANLDWKTPAKPSAVYAYPKATAEHGQTYERLDNWQDEPTPATGTTFSTHPDKLTD